MKTNYPSLCFGLNESEQMLQDTVVSFASTEIAPRANDIDRNNDFPSDYGKRWVHLACWVSPLKNNMVAAK